MAVEGSHEEHVIINGTLLQGVSNTSFEQNVEEQAVSMVGKEFAGKTTTGPTQVTASIDKYLLNSDFVTTLAGLTNISGQFEYGDNLLDFSQAVINGYSVSAGVGSLPEISFDLSIYGSLSGSDTSIRSLASDESAVENVPQSGLIVTFDKNQTNAVQSFNFSETFNVVPTYGLGQKTPADISIVGPVVQEANISIEVEDYEIEETFSFLSGSKDRSRNIELKISGDNGVLNTFSLQNGCLASESIVSSAGNTTTAQLTYRGYRT
tara:strand:+ start:130 stop:924 length:795 start_codon:yes stop_codon:yes gene_type:complete